MFFRWIPIVFSSMYDDMVLSVYFSTKEFIAKQLQVTDFDIYHSGTSYSIGFLFGGIIWNILTKKWSAKRILFVSQLALITCVLSQMFQGAVWQLFIIRFLQGLFASGAFIAINILVKHNFTQNDFNKFLALNTVIVYIIEASLPLIIMFLNNRYNFQISLAFFAFLLLVSTYTKFLNFKDVDEHVSLKVATKKAVQSYMDIIQSRLILVLLFTGISEGVVDMLFNVFDQMVYNSTGSFSSNLVSISISIVSVFSSMAVAIMPFFSPDPLEETNTEKRFDWKHVNGKDKTIVKISIYILIPLLVLNCFNPFRHQYLFFLIPTILIMIVLCVVHYIGVKIMHSVYFSSGCIASAILLSENFFSAGIQGASHFLAKVNDNRTIFLYTLLYLLLIAFLNQQFFKRVKEDKSESISE